MSLDIKTQVQLKQEQINTIRAFEQLVEGDTIQVIIKGKSFNFVMPAKEDGTFKFVLTHGIGILKFEDFEVE